MATISAVDKNIIAYCFNVLNSCKTSASVELTQTRHSHSKQLFQGETDFSVATGRVKKLHTLLVSLYF